MSMEAFGSIKGLDSSRQAFSWKTTARPQVASQARRRRRLSRPSRAGVGGARAAAGPAGDGEVGRGRVLKGGGAKRQRERRGLLESLRTVPPHRAQNALHRKGRPRLPPVPRRPGRLLSCALGVRSFVCDGRGCRYGDG